MRVLISGASIAGPVTAYWLTRRGFDVTVVERAPALRKTGGHAVDLFRPAMDISERMGVLPQIHARTTGTDDLVFHRPGARKPVTIDYRKLTGAMSDRHVEIMRDDLSDIYYCATQDDVEYIFGDQITRITDDGHVSFAHAAPRRFDVIVGADGLHSGVRQLVFGPDSGHTDYLGGCLAVISVPKTLAREGESTGYVDVDRLTMIYTARHLDDARAVFIFRPAAPPQVDHRDLAGQHAILRNQFAGMAPEVDSWLTELDRTQAFYFDSITQLQLTTWSRGRVTLVGDAAYCPGPAVGGSTSLAVLGAYVLAGELQRAGGDHAAAFAAYETVMASPVEHSRVFARNVARLLVPTSRLRLRALVHGLQLVSLLPTGLSKAVARLNDKGVRLYDSMPVPNYDESVTA
jgi:2-polyprenyl-6-methoxyphenol hydroxylase-like FAD-dependent oxidoreductase